MMAEGKGPRVYFNPDGYIELVLAGTAVFGFRPIYVDDEAEARALAAN